MLEWIAKNRHAPVLLLAGCLLLGLPRLASGQTSAPVQTAQFDPSDLYFQGYLAIRAAEKLEAQGDFVAAAEKLERARKLIDTVRRYHPDWKSEMVNGRSAQNAVAIEKIRPKAEEQRRKNRSVVAELEGGVRNSGTLADPADATIPAAPSVLEADPLTARRLADAEAEVKRLRDLAKKNAAADKQTTNNESRIREIARERDAALVKLSAAESNVQTLRGRLDTAPEESEIKALKQQIAGLEQQPKPDPLTTRRLADAEEEVKRLRDLAKDNAAADKQLAENESRTREIARERDAALAKLSAAEGNVKTLRGSLDTAPEESEIKALKQQIAGLEQKREPDPLTVRRLADAEAEVKRLRDLAKNNAAADKQLAENESRTREIARERDAALAKLSAAEGNVQTLRGRLDTAPEESEIKALKQQIAGLEQQRKPDPLTTRRLADAEEEVKRLRDLAKSNNAAISEAARNESRVRDIARQRDAAQAELKEAETKLQSLRSQLATAPAESEIKALKQKIAGLEQQRAPDPLTTRRLADAEAEVKQLREHAKSNDAALGEAARNESRVTDIARQRDAAQAELKEAETKLQSLRSQLAGAPAESDVKALRQRIADQEKERETMSQTERRLAESQSEVKRLREQATTNSALLNEAARSESRARDVSKQRDALQADLSAAEKNLQSLRDKLAAAPVESEMKTLNQNIAGLEQEREAMAMALTQSRSAHNDALSRNAVLEADLKVTRQKYANIDRDLKAERKVSNEVVAGQRAQLQDLGKELSQKTADLQKANERIGGLMNELKESHDTFAQLRTERDSLLQERDQMSAVLKLNEDGRIQDLIQQNMGLVKNLREANEKVERLAQDGNSAKAEVSEALSDLAIAKSKINKLNQEKRDQDSRLADLEQRLKGEEAALAKGQVAADPAEVAVLRDIIQRQLRVQERRRQARELLVETVKEMGTKDERIAQAIELFDSQEIELSPQEQRLIADKNVDGEFVSPFAQDRATVGRNTSDLNRDINVFERTAEKAFAAGHLLPTRELFQMIVDQHPGHVPSLCKLGVVNLRLKDTAAAADSFRRAVELDNNNPYAHRMLGFALMNLDDLPAAEISIKQATTLAPNDAKSHMLLGVISQRLGRTAEAESHYKAAISADPLPSDSYYNLARLYSLNQRMGEAKKYYVQALERGAVPNPKLEKRLAQP